MSDLKVQDLTWTSTPALMAGISFYVEETSRPLRMYWRARGVVRGLFEVGLRTMRGNKFAFMSGDNIEEVDEYVNALMAMNAQQVADHFVAVDQLDSRMGYDHGITDALMTQWREACFAWAGVVAGDFIITYDDQEITTVDGTGFIPAGTPFEVRDVFFNEDRTVMSLSSTGDVVEIPWDNYKLLAPRWDRSGRESYAGYIYNRHHGFKKIKKGDQHGAQ